MKNIQVFNPLIRLKSMQEVNKVLLSGWLGCGPKVRQFEEDFQKFLSTKNKCTTVMSATDGLEIAMQLLDFKQGDEILTTPITFISTNHTIRYHNATPIFCDIDPFTGCISPDSIRSKITTKTKAIVVVHLSGSAADMEQIEKIAEENNLPIIEDCAHAAGGFYYNGKNSYKRIGNSNNICVFSFQAVKNLPVGDGGMMVLPTEDLAQKALKLRWLGIDKDTYSRTAKTGEYLWKYDVPYLGIKSNLNDIAGAIGIEQLKYLDSDNARRREIARFYRDNLENHPRIILPNINIEMSSCHFYPILVEDRDVLMQKMRDEGVSCGMHYQRNDKYAGYTLTELPGAQEWNDKEITLPIHLHLTNEDLEYIVNIIRSGW